MIANRRFLGGGNDHGDSTWFVGGVRFETAKGGGTIRAKAGAENVVTRGVVYRILRPLLFSVSPRTAHATGMGALWALEHLAPWRATTKALLSHRDPSLHTTVMGLSFPSPVGLAGGFDKNAQRPRALASLGFGFLELGTITALPQAENPPPNLFRLAKDRAIINRLGFPNDGATYIAARLAGRRLGVPVGISIGKSRPVPLEPLRGVIDDYLTSFRAVRDVADFIVVNVSSPNTKGLRALQGAEMAEQLLAALMEENRSQGRALPILVKIAPDLTDEDLLDLLDAIRSAKIAGVVATNTTLARSGLKTPARDVAAIGLGGLSGPPLRERAIGIVTTARARLGPDATVIGVGGIETAKDALAFIRAGANLVQLYTGFIYGGPMTPARITRGLARLVKQAGASNISELVGKR